MHPSVLPNKGVAADAAAAAAGGRLPQQFMQELAAQKPAARAPSPGQGLMGALGGGSNAKPERATPLIQVVDASPANSQEQPQVCGLRGGMGGGGHASTHSSLISLSLSHTHTHTVTHTHMFLPRKWWAHHRRGARPHHHINQTHTHARAC